MIDSIAAESIRLHQYYAHPVCTPTRAALLTGRYAVNVGLPFPLLAHAIAGLEPSTPTLPEVLKQEAGYAPISLPIHPPNHLPTYSDIHQR